MAEMVSSDIAKITLDRPTNFNYHAGDVIFVRIPHLSSYEWHPFTMSSAPSDEKGISLHIRNLGDWTDKLCLLCKEGSPHNEDPILIHGPYSTPTFTIFNSEIAVLVATGIGATPFAGVIKEWLYLRKTNSPQVSKLKKIIFIWVHRDEDAALWMQDLLQEVNQEQLQDSIDVILYETRPAATAEKRLPEDTTISRHTGRPSWDQLFQNITKKHSGQKINVYLCGAEAVAHDVGRQCKTHHLNLYRERF